VFLLNSRFFFFSVSFIKPLLFPKLQSKFAEFLQYNYLERLSIFYSSTCVGLRYGFGIIAISRKQNINNF